MSCYLVTTLLTYAQDKKKIDSLEIELTNVEVDTIKVKLLEKLGYEYGKSDLDKKLDYGLKTKKLSEKIDYKIGVLHALSMIAQVYDTKGELEKAMEIHQKVMEIAKQLNWKFEIARAFNSIGNNYLMKVEHQLALENYLQGLKLCDELGGESNSKSKIKRQISDFYNNMALVYNNLGNPERALEFYEKGIKNL